MTTPTATRAHAEIAARLRTVIARLNRQLRQQSAGTLTLSQLSALVSIETVGPMRIGELADSEHVSAPTATRLVASLEAEHLVERVVDDGDRRSALISLSRQGALMLAEERRRRTEALAGRLSRWSTDDVDRLTESLPLLERLAGHDRS